MSPEFLQFFLFFNVFLIGVLTTVAARHAYAHFRPAKPEVKEPPRPATEVVHLPTAVRERLVNNAQVNFNDVVERSARELDDKLNATSIQLNKQLEQVGTEIINDEMKRYRQRLDELRSWTETSMGGAEKQIVRHQAELKAKLDERQVQLEKRLEEDMAAEKEAMVKRLDTKLADAVASFLVETLQHNVDLGAQSAYLTATLEEHKAELVKGVVNEP